MVEPIPYPRWSYGQACVNCCLNLTRSVPVPIVLILAARPKNCSAISLSFSTEGCPGSMPSLGVAGGSWCNTMIEKKLNLSRYLVTSAVGSSNSLCSESENKHTTKNKVNFVFDILILYVLTTVVVASSSIFTM